MTRVLVTGAGGFLGGHLLDHILANTDWDIITVDREKFEPGRRITPVAHDLTTPLPEIACDYIIAAASEVSVPQSIADPISFVMNNTAITLNTLELAREMQPKAVLLVSTNEVYGPGRHSEWDPVVPQSPYAASKAAQEALAISYWHSYGIPVIIVNTMNLFGERQEAGRFIPKVAKAVSRGDDLGIHAGSRNWIHARNLSDGIIFLLKHEAELDYPARFNIAGKDEIYTLHLAMRIAGYMNKDLKWHWEGSDRVGHGSAYSLDISKISALGWKAPRTFSESLKCTLGQLNEH